MSDRRLIALLNGFIGGILARISGPGAFRIISTVTADRDLTLPDANVTLTAGTSIAGSIANTQVAVGSGTNTVAGSSQLIWDTSAAIYNRVVKVTGTGSAGYQSDDGTRSWIFGSNSGTFQIYDATGTTARMSVNSSGLFTFTGSSTINGTASITSTTDSTTTATGSIITAGGLGVAKNAVMGAKVAIGSAAVIAPYHDLAVTGINTFGCRKIGNGCDLSILSNGQGGGFFSNWYYNAADKAAYLGYCPKFEMITSDGSIRLSTTASTVAADANIGWSERMRIDLNGIVSTFSTTDATAVGTASVVMSGGLGVAKRSFLGTIGGTFAGNVLAGVQSGAAAVAGQVGEVLSSTVTGVAVAATGAVGNATSLSITAGDWIISAHGVVSGGATGLTAASVQKLSIVTTTATNGVEGDTMQVNTIAALTANGKHGLSIPQIRINISATTTYYLTEEVTYAAGSPTIAAKLIATRVR